ncbi:MAG TPA: uroporphyrinogen-III synthase [Steroidobacteraceae bacterium]|nr:uroporphyrinogen-III synthase [Steroidobacteraceae bacterium]
MSSGASAWPVVVTRDEPADGPLSRELRALGLAVLGWRVLSVGPAAETSALTAALARLNEFGWLVFASQHAVAEMVRRVPVPPADVQIAAVGARTAQALTGSGWPVSLVPGEHTAEALVAALAPRLAPGTKVLFPAGSRSLPTIREGLTAAGAAVTQVDTYSTRSAPLDVRTCRDWVGRRAIGAVTFTSPSAVEELDRALGPRTFDELLESAAAITLGPTTGRTLAARGFPSVLAVPGTLSGMARTTYRLLRMR